MLGVIEADCPTKFYAHFDAYTKLDGATVASAEEYNFTRTKHEAIAIKYA